MNPITDIVFSITWVLLLVWAIRTMSKGWNLMSQNTPKLNGEWTTEVKKPTLPEMIEVKPGDKLMGVTFNNRDELDYKLQKSLQNRIDEIEDMWDNDDGDSSTIIRK